ncbi:MAG: hypothetical protein C4582_08295 [Desulfobacteraceae bacterium]|nr:MAG: hypothetical protein C4582_08295 [Desulfobacteraceae bacterium]
MAQSLIIDPQNPLLPTMIQQVEKNAIETDLRRSTTRTEAINMLGISRRTFYKKLKQHDLLVRHLPRT